MGIKTRNSLKKTTTNTNVVSYKTSKMSDYDTFQAKAIPMADIPMNHAERNLAKCSKINKAITRSNHLIKIANMSFYHQSKNEFVLTNQELKLLKSCNINVPRIDKESYCKSREFQLILKDRAMRILTL